MIAATTPARANPEAGPTIPAPLPPVGAGVSVGVSTGPVGEPPVVVVKFPPTTEEMLEKMEENEEMISLVGMEVGRVTVGSQSVPMTVSVTQTVSIEKSLVLRFWAMDDFDD